MKTNERIYVDLHVLQTVPPSCVNRDDTGSPKTAVYGGVTRARVSSQAWKHAMRGMFCELLSEGDVGKRTKMVVNLIVEKLAELRPDLSKEQCQKMAKAALEAAGVKVKDDKENLKTGALFFISTAQVSALAQLAAEAGKKKPDKAACQEALKMQPGVDMALFGRMVADDPSLNFDAAAQVAHAISTHAVENEYDYFTAVDDCAPKDNAGAGHLGTVEFNSSTLYRYATVNVGELASMLGTKTPEAVRAFAEAFIRSMPTGKQNPFANRTRPDAVYVAVRNDQPINMAGAFEKPVREKGEGYVANSVAALVDYAQETYASFAEKPVLALTVGKGTEKLAQPCSVDELLDALEHWLKDNGGEQK